jgi:hypothetical protein
MKSSRLILQALLIAGAVYFFAVGVVHFLGQKVPGLYIYFNVESFSYQDKIISLLAIGWSAFYALGFFMVAWKKVPYIILHIASGAFAIIALITINAGNDLSLLGLFQDKTPYWIAVILLSIYLIALLVFYLLSLKKLPQKGR